MKSIWEQIVTNEWTGSPITLSATFHSSEDVDIHSDLFVSNRNETRICIDNRGRSSGILLYCNNLSPLNASFVYITTEGKFLIEATRSFPSIFVSFQTCAFEGITPIVCSSWACSTPEFSASTFAQSTIRYQLVVVVFPERVLESPFCFMRWSRRITSACFAGVKCWWLWRYAPCFDQEQYETG